MLIQLFVEDLNWLYRSKKCELRLYNHYKGLKQDPQPTHVRHNQTQLQQLIEEQDRQLPERGCRTFTESAFFDIDKDRIQLTGTPDLVYWCESQNGYVLQVCTLDVDPDKDSTEARRLRLYDRLFTWAWRKSPVRLELVSPGLKVTQIQPSKGNKDGLGDSAWMVRALLKAKNSADYNESVYSAYGKIKCSDCPFTSNCLEKAKDSKDVALVPGVSPTLTEELRNTQQVSNIPQLLEMSPEQLAEVEGWSPEDNTRKPIGIEKASFILRGARALNENRVVVSTVPALPASDNCVILDLEGLPASREPELNGDRIYLWGMLLSTGCSTHGSNQCDLSELATFRNDSDYRCWSTFLDTAQRVLDAWNPPFYHWYEYERKQIETYIERYKDRMTEEEHSTAQRVLANLVDLLPITKDSVSLPLYSYGLKQIESYLGFSRSQEDFGGKWSISQYELARDTQDERKRYELLYEIVTYNGEDLKSTLAIYKWLKTLRPD